jgi:hypothetical protein
MRGICRHSSISINTSRKLRVLDIESRVFCIPLPPRKKHAFASIRLDLGMLKEGERYDFSALSVRLLGHVPFIICPGREWEVTVWSCSRGKHRGKSLILHATRVWRCQSGLWGTRRGLVVQRERPLLLSFPKWGCLLNRQGHRAGRCSMALRASYITVVRGQFIGSLVASRKLGPDLNLSTSRE